MGYSTIRVACNGKGCRLHDKCTNAKPHDLTTGCGDCRRSSEADCVEIEDETK